MKNGRPKRPPNIIIITQHHMDRQYFLCVLHNFLDLHKSGLCILYNIAYCKTQKNVLSYRHKR